MPGSVVKILMLALQHYCTETVRCYVVGWMFRYPSMTPMCCSNRALDLEVIVLDETRCPYLVPSLSYLK